MRYKKSSYLNGYIHFLRYKCNIMIAQHYAHYCFFSSIYPIHFNAFGGFQDLHSKDKARLTVGVEAKFKKDREALINPLHTGKLKPLKR